jgi:hypothetical protein
MYTCICMHVTCIAHTCTCICTDSGKKAKTMHENCSTYMYMVRSCWVQIKAKTMHENCSTYMYMVVAECRSMRGSLAGSERVWGCLFKVCTTAIILQSNQLDCRVNNVWIHNLTLCAKKVWLAKDEVYEVHVPCEVHAYTVQEAARRDTIWCLSNIELWRCWYSNTSCLLESVLRMSAIAPDFL